MATDEDASHDCVGDDEILYRSVRQLPQEIFLDSAGEVRVSPQAFADKSKQPSLYRHDLCDDPPSSNPPRMSPDQAVVSLVAGKIRQEAGPIEHKPEKQDQITYVIDVKPDTTNHQHRSHAIVYANPDFHTNGAFEKLKMRLSLLVEGWAIEPDKAFLEQLKAGNQ